MKVKMSKIAVVSVSADNWIAETYERNIITGLSKKFDSVSHIGLSLEMWYGGTVSKIYRKYNRKLYTLPRVDKSGKDWWHDKDNIYHYLQSAHSIITLVRNIIKTENPDIIILADDVDPIEVLIIRLFEERGIPVVVLEHGYGKALQRIKDIKLLTTTLATAPRTIEFYLLIVLSKLLRVILNVSFDIPIYTNSFGRNGNYPICTISELTTNIYLKMGIKKNRLFNTGFPYWDNLFAIRLENNAKPRYIRKKIIKILFISTGWGKFNRTNREDGFYNMVLKLNINSSQKYKFFLRLKPGSKLLSRHKKQLQKANISLDDNSIPSRAAISKYDLIIGSDSSVLLEAALLDIPVLYLNNTDGVNPNPYHEIILKENLNIKPLNLKHNLYEQINTSLSKTYRNKVTESVKLNAKNILNGFDGQSGTRVVDVIINILGKKK